MIRPFFFAAAFLFLISASDYLYARNIELGPLLDVQREGDNAKKIEFLGPLVFYKRSEYKLEHGLRPLYFFSKDMARNTSEFSILYPLAGYRKYPGLTKYQAFIHILSYETQLNKSGYREREFTLFPFIFFKKAERDENSFFALFPLFGTLKNKFFKDEINFLFFPLFIQTRNGEEINRHFLWPFFGVYKGGGQKGFRLWPLYGYRKKKDKLDEKFVLWPFYVKRKKVFYDEEINSLSILPFYSTIESDNRKVTTYLWPFFNHLKDEVRGIERWDIPWPIFNITRGKKTQNRFFPFFSKEIENVTEENQNPDKDGFILWPLYKYEETYFVRHKRRRDRLLLVLYSDVRETPTAQGGRDTRRIDLWPLFSYERDREGHRKFHFLSILEPFVKNNRGIEKSYAPFWRIINWNSDGKGASTVQILWNTYKYQKNAKGKKWRFQPIIPIFSYKDWEGVNGFSLLGGLLGYEKSLNYKKLRILYIPFTMSSGDAQTNTTDENE